MWFFRTCLNHGSGRSVSNLLFCHLVSQSSSECAGTLVREMVIKGRAGPSASASALRAPITCAICYAPEKWVPRPATPFSLWGLDLPPRDPQTTGRHTAGLVLLGEILALKLRTDINLSPGSLFLGSFKFPKNLCFFFREKREKKKLEPLSWGIL